MNNKSGNPPRTPRRFCRNPFKREDGLFSRLVQKTARGSRRVCNIHASFVCVAHSSLGRLRRPFEAPSGLSASIAFKRWSGRSGLRDRARNVRNRLRGEHPSMEARITVRSERYRRLQPDNVG